MSDEPVILTPPQGYAEWLAELKAASTPRSSAPPWRSTANW